MGDWLPRGRFGKMVRRVSWNRATPPSLLMIMLDKWCLVGLVTLSGRRTWLDASHIWLKCHTLIFMSYVYFLKKIIKKKILSLDRNLFCFSFFCRYIIVYFSSGSIIEDINLVWWAWKESSHWVNVKILDFPTYLC